LQQIDNLTGVRAFAAISVMMFHIRYDHLADRYGAFAFLFKNGALGVEVFFILSGFILAYVHYRDFTDGIAPAAVRQFLESRLARIYPAHLFMLLVVAFALPRFGLYNWSPVDTWPAFWANVFLIHSWGDLSGGLTFNQVSWSISAEWFAYLCFPLLALGTTAWRAWMFASLGAVCTWTEPALIPTLLLSGYTFGMSTIAALLFFIVGFCTFRLGQNLPPSRLWRIGSGTLGPFLVFIFWMQVPYLQYLFIALTAALILCLFKSGPSFLYANPVSVYLGKISYSLYMSHIITFSALRTLTGEVMQLRIEIPLVLAIAAAIYHFIEQPFRALMRSQRLRMSLSSAN